MGNLFRKFQNNERMLENEINMGKLKKNALKSRSKTSSTYEKEERMLMLYNAITYTLCQWIGIKADDPLNILLDYLAPICDINELMDKFDNQYDIAMQLYRDLANIIKCWEMQAVKSYEYSKLQLIEIRKIELFLKFLEEQRNSFNFFTTKHAESQGLDKIKALQSLYAIVTKIHLSDKVYSLDDALNQIHNKKSEIEKCVEMYCLYARCVKELGRTNTSNIAKIYSSKMSTKPKAKEGFHAELDLILRVNALQQMFKNKKS